jgi:hypothetical protein
MRNADENPQAGLIAQLFLDRAGLFLDQPDFVPLLVAAHQSPAFDALRPAIIAVFAAGLARPEGAVVRACFAAFCSVSFTIRDIPVSDLIARAAEGQYAVETIALLARLPQLPVSTRLINTLVTVGGQSSLTARCLCRLALSLKGAQAVLANPKWMDNACLTIADAVVLLLVVCRFSDTRDALAEVVEFPDLVVRVVASGEGKELEAMIVVLRKMAISAEFVKVLDSKGFFGVFIPRAIESCAAVLQDGAILVVAHFAKVAWTNGFVYLMQYFPGMLACGGVLGRKTILVTLTLAVYQQARAPLLYLNLEQAVTACQVEPAFQQFKDSLLAYLAA